MDKWGEFEGVYRLLDCFPYGLVVAVYFHANTLLAEALLPQGTATLFSCGFNPAGQMIAAECLPGSPAGRSFSIDVAGSTAACISEVQSRVAEGTLTLPTATHTEWGWQGLHAIRAQLPPDPNSNLNLSLEEWFAADLPEREPEAALTTLVGKLLTGEYGVNIQGWESVPELGPGGEARGLNLSRLGSNSEPYLL